MGEFAGCAVSRDGKVTGVVAGFFKSAGGRLTLDSLVVLTESVSRHDGKTYCGRDYFDVDYSRRFGYIWHLSGGGGPRVIDVNGIYFTSGEVSVKESPVALVDYRDRSPWKSERTLAIRKRNRTRRLRGLPKSFILRSGENLVDWMSHNAIDDDAVYCSECRDYVTGQDLCGHCWWCDANAWYSTPSERCDCTSRDACREDESAAAAKDAEVRR